MECEEGRAAVLRLQTPNRKGKRERREQKVRTPRTRVDTGAPPPPPLGHPCQPRLLEVLGFVTSAESDQWVMTSPRSHLQPRADWKILKASPLCCHSCCGAREVQQNKGYTCNTKFSNSHVLKSNRIDSRNRSTQIRSTELWQRYKGNSVDESLGTTGQPYTKKAKGNEPQLPILNKE